MSDRLTKDEIRKKYRELPRKEKEIIGSSLVKVNLGVALPADLKRVATFLKGSPFIAKTGTLDSVIQFLHNDEDSNPLPPNAAIDETSISPAQTHGLATYTEDEVTTTKSSKEIIKE